MIAGSAIRSSSRVGATFVRAVPAAASLLSSGRAFSSELSVEELKEATSKVERHKKHVQKSALPTTMTNLTGPGVELHVPEDLTEIAALTGMPKEHQNRTVMIAPRPLKTLQSGDAQSYQWQLTWKNSNRWNNPLMGWASSADPMSQVKLNFDSEEDAIAYAKRNGWKFEVRQRHADANENIEVGTMTYSHNFLTARTTMALKEARDAGKKSLEYARAGENASNWFPPLNFDGTGDARQHGPRGKAQ